MEHLTVAMASFGQECHLDLPYSVIDILYTIGSHTVVVFVAICQVVSKPSDLESNPVNNAAYTSKPKPGRYAVGWTTVLWLFQSICPRV